MSRDVIEGEIVARDGQPVCAHRDSHTRSHVPGAGPRIRCDRCSKVIAGVPDQTAITAWRRA